MLRWKNRTLTVDCDAKLKKCPASLPLTPLSREIEPVFIDLSFEAVPEPGLRKELLTMPTSFSLNKDDVDKVIRAGEELLENAPAFQTLKKEIGEAAAH